jgi:hypothetical protein
MPRGQLATNGSGGVMGTGTHLTATQMGWTPPGSGTAPAPGAGNDLGDYNSLPATITPGGVADAISPDAPPAPTTATTTSTTPTTPKAPTTPQTPPPTGPVAGWDPAGWTTPNYEYGAGAGSPSGGASNSAYYGSPPGMAPSGYLFRSPQKK